MRVPFPQVPQRRVLTDWVADSLREAILAGCFEPGEKLDQETIAQELDVSRTPVREAMSKLESEGFVEVRPHRGAFVVVPSQSDIEDAYDLLSILETELIRQVTPLVSEELLDEMDRRLTDDQSKLERGDSAEYFKIDSPRFPTAVFELAHNRLFREVMVSLSSRIEVVRCLAQRQPRPDLGDSLKEHRAILDAMRKRDAQQAAELTKAHLAQSSRRVLALMEQVGWD